MPKDSVRAALLLALLAATVAIPWTAAARDGASQRPRARDAGIVIGNLPTGPRNAIVDVAGVAVGHATVVEGDGVRTGVTAILPHAGDLYAERVPAAIHVANGYGKLLGISQVRELGELETPILLTGTLGVWTAADALVDWQLARPGMEAVRSLNPVVGETNDGFLNDIRARPLQAAHVRAALAGASTSNVDEGAVGAGTGTVAFGWKGGIGTSSRVVADARGEHVVGVLVQSNYGGTLTIAGVPVGPRLPDPAQWRPGSDARTGADAPPTDGDGSIMIVVATDAPLDARQLERLARRAIVGLARTGASMSNGSGDYVIAFSTAPAMRRIRGQPVAGAATLDNEAMTPLFVAVADATGEAILNSMFRARGMRGHRGEVPALPLERVLPMLRGAGATSALVDPAARDHEAAHAQRDLHQRLGQPRPLEAEVVVDMADRPGADHGGRDPHHQEALQLHAAHRGVLAGEGETSVHPEAAQRAADAPDHVGLAYRQSGVAERDHHRPVQHPLQAADHQVTARLADDAQREDRRAVGVPERHGANATSRAR